MNTKKTQENLPESTPVYYSLILTRSYNIYIAYFAIFIICLVQMGYVKNCIPVLVWIAASCIARKKVSTIPIRWNLLFYVCISVGWITYFIYCYGWNCGGINFMMPLLLVSMFSIYDRLFNKIIFTIFLFVAFGNVLGLFPYAFTFTSHLAAVGGLSVIALLFNIGIGIKKKKLGWLRTFMPKGIPFALAPLIIPIEMISFLSKPFSLTVRLVANMTVGHIMLKIIAGFVVTLGFLGIVPLAFDACIIVFEIFIALLQAFIYTVLSCIYLGDALHSH